MIKFEVGKTYKNSQGYEFTYLSRNENNIGLFKFRLVTRKYKILPFCGVEAAMCMDGTRILARSS